MVSALKIRAWFLFLQVAGNFHPSAIGAEVARKTLLAHMAFILVLSQHVATRNACLLLTRAQERSRRLERWIFWLTLPQRFAASSAG